jgi:hypothetical protein
VGTKLLVWVVHGQLGPYASYVLTLKQDGQKGK